MEKINIGKIVNVVGLKGEVKIYHYTDYKERFEEMASIFTDVGEYKIDNVRYLKNLVILKLQGVDDRNSAEKLKDVLIYIEETDLRELPADTYYIRDLIGVSVYDEQDLLLGKLSDVFQNAAQDIYEVETEKNTKFLIPAVGEFVLKIDMDNRKMIVKLIEGIM